MENKMRKRYVGEERWGKKEMIVGKLEWGVRIYNFFFFKQKTAYEITV